MAKYKAFVRREKLPGIFAIRKTYFYSSRRNSKLRIKSNFSVFALETQDNFKRILFRDIPQTYQDALH
jgi:hypothetical protein